MSLDDVAARIVRDDAPENAAQLFGRLLAEGRDVEMSDAERLWDEHGAGAPEATPEAIREHYTRLTPLYETLGELDGDDGAAFCPANHDFSGWYKEDHREKTGDGGRARPWILGKEFDTLRRETNRVVYSTVNYAPGRFFLDGWDTYRWKPDGDGDWRRAWSAGDSPLPGYGDLCAYAPFADIDLEDDFKHARPGGDVPKGTVEDALQRYIDAFAELAGTRDAVHALDSVGGAYVMLSPTTTAPIGAAFDAADRDLIFDELTDRLNSWLGDVADDVTDAVPDSEGVFEPDLVNNKNRLYKAPLSVHSSLDGVVTPVDTDAPTYDYTPLHAVGDADRRRATEWAESFTDDYSECVSAVVATLWSEADVDADGWEATLRAWVRSKRAEETARERTDEKRAEAARKKLAEYEGSDEEYADYDTVTAAAEALDVRDVAAHFADRWDTAPGRDPPRFAPSWRQSSSGESCFADREKFVDLKEKTSGGGAVKLAARAEGIITHCNQSVTGTDFRRAVAVLRSAGFDVPLLERKGKPTLEEAGFGDDPTDAKEAAQKFLAMQELDGDD